MYTVPPQYHGYADPNPSPHLANADQLMDNVFVGAPQPKGMQKVFKRVNKTVHKMGKRDPGSGTDDSDFEYQHVEDDHEVKRAERGKKKPKNKKPESLGIEDLIPTQEQLGSPEKPKKSTKTKKKKSSRKFQSDPLMYQHDSLAVDEDEGPRPPQPPPHNPYMLYPTHVPFGAHQTPYQYYAMQQEMQRQQMENYWRQQEYQQGQAQQPRRKKDKNFAYISPGDNAFYTSPEEHQRKQYEKMMGQQRQPGSWDGIIDPTQDQEYGFRSNYNPWFGGPMGHALGGVPMQEPPRQEREREREVVESETSTQITAETGYTERTGSSGSGSGTGSGTGSSGSETRSATSQVNKRNLFPNFGAFIPPPSQDEKVSRFSAKNIFGKRTVSESRESLVSRDTETSVSRDAGDSGSRVSATSSHHPLSVPPSPGSYFYTTSFSLNEEPIRPQSSVSQRGMMMQRGTTPYNIGGEYMMPEVPHTESTVSASEEHSRALYNVWTGLTSTVKDWVSSYDQTNPVKEGAADNFFSQVYKNAFGQSVPQDNYTEVSAIPQEIPLPEDPSDDEFDARSMMEEDAVIGEIPAAGGAPMIYEEDIENRNKKRLKKTMKFLLRKKGKDGVTVVGGEDPEGAIDEQGVPIGAVLKFRRSPLTKMKRSVSGSSARPGSSGSAHGSLIDPPGSAGSVSTNPPAPDAPKLQQFMYKLALLAEQLQPHFDKLGALVRSHPVGATFMYPMDAAVAVHPKLKFVALGLEIVVLLCVLYVVASVVSSILTVLRFLFAPLIWILGVGAKKKK
ncbi:hypothetical protein CJU89_3131 [Yarrowia sp. B02]|nr:hypothetical protein CJU89_3131 [Yarrowia sp. B02]